MADRPTQLPPVTLTGDGALRGRDPDGPGLERGTPIGRYIVVGEIGRGGMGVVYAAYDPDLDRKIAIKLLRAKESDASESDRKRLLREAQAMARLSHPNVVTVFEVGTAAGRDFVAMEFVDGANLADWIAERRPAARAGVEDRVAFARRVLELFVEAGRGLAAAHRAGIVHRDLKPANILVGSDGRARVGDFGIARPAAGSEEASDVAVEPARLGATTAILGTPAYMAPEQFTNDPTGARSDQFSFCVALWEALQGSRPFHGATYAELRESVCAGRLEGEPDAAAMPPHLRRALERGLSADPSERFESMEELLDAIRTQPRKARRRLAMASGALVVAGLVLAIVGRGERSDDPPVCSGTEDRLAGVWDPDLRKKTLAAFTMSGLDYAGEAYRAYASALDQYADSWVTQYKQSCRSTYVDREQPESVHALRVNCLQARLDELRSLAAVFSEVDARGVDQAGAAAARLAPVSDCADIDSLRKGIQPPADDRVREKVAQVRSQLAEVKALREARRGADARKSAREALAQARKTKYGPVIAEAMLRLGELLADTSEAAQARKLLEEAALQAEESNYEEVRAQALIEITRLVVRTSSRSDEAQRWARRARASIARLGVGTEMETSVLDRIVARLHHRDGELDQALSLLRGSRVALNRLLRDDHRAAEHRRARVELASTERRLAEVFLERGEREHALTSARRALSIIESDHGKDHPRAIELVELTGHCLRDMGKLDAAREQFVRVRRFYRTDRGRYILEQRKTVEPGTLVIGGRVIDSSGAPVAGADVTIADAIVGDARYAYTSMGARYEHRSRVAFAKTDATGRFSFLGQPKGKRVLIAEHPRLGRSWPNVTTAKKGAVSLKLRRFGALRGRLVNAGERSLPRMMVQAVYLPATNPPAAAVFGILEPDGSYRFERLAAGTYELFYITNPEHVATRPLGMESRKVTVKPGPATELDLDLPTGRAKLEVRVTGERGATIPSAQIVLFRGKVDVKRARQINALVIDGRGLQTGFVVDGGPPARFGGLSLGRYSACLIPLSMDHLDPALRKELGKVIEELETHCFAVQVRSTEGTTRASFAVPPMRVLKKK